MPKSNKKSKSNADAWGMDESIVADIPIDAIDIIKDMLGYERIMKKHTNKLLYEKNCPKLREGCPRDIYDLIESYVGDIKFNYRRKTKKGEERLGRIDIYCMFHHTECDEDNLISRYWKKFRKKISGKKWRILSVAEPIDDDRTIIPVHPLTILLDSLNDRTKFSADTRNAAVALVKSIEQDNKRHLASLNRTIDITYRCYRCFHCLDTNPHFYRHDDFIFFDEQYSNGDIIPIDNDIHIGVV
jgi:hypothetical protein